MAVTTEEILARGQGPVQTTGANQATTKTAPAETTQPTTTAVSNNGSSVQANGTVNTSTVQSNAQTDTDVEHTVETVTDNEQVIPVDKQQTAPEGKKLSYVEMHQLMSPYKPPTPEELEKERKKQKREAIFAAIGEGISAMSNLYFTTQYAPNAFDPSKGMAASTKARFDQLKKDREQNQREYMNGYMRAMQMDAADARDERNWNHTLWRERISDERYAVKAAQDKALADLNEKLKGHQITKAEYEAKIAEIKAAHAEEDAGLHTEGLREGIKQKKASTAASYASAKASNARANHYRNGAGKKGPKLQLEEEQPMQFDNDTDYDRTVMRLAPDYNVPTTRTIVTERYAHGSKKGQPKKQRIEQRPVKDIAADIEREAAKRKGSNTNNYENTKKLGL